MSRLINLRSTLFLFVLVTPCSAALAAISDLLIALESDGRSHTVQHTVGSNGTEITLALPGSIIPQEVRFIGPDQAAQAEAYKLNPRQVQINSGSAFARYHHQYGQAVVKTAEGEYALTTASRPDNISVQDGELEESSITWVFPSDFEITSYTVTDTSIGRWVAENNMLSFYQVSGEPVTLGIRYRYIKSARSSDAEVVDVCSEPGNTIDACAPDNDLDGVPDYRDLCLSSSGGKSGEFGCDGATSMVLDAIKFRSGNSYLDVSARQLLDRVASAIQRQPESYFEIGAHTDNNGAADFNQQLSTKRAEAVRHYLMLKGVDPNKVRAKGYGETYPLKDNSSDEGRRANRRIELTKITK